ncbi:MAG: hypothetical protein ACREA9_24175 [Pyrinomonadaceae bacterium]
MPQITGRTFYTTDDALAYLKSKVSDLFAARGTLQDAYGRALLAQSKSLTPENRARVTQLVADLTAALGDQKSLEDKVRTVVPAAWVPQQLGILPLIIGAGVIAVAAAVYLHLQNVSAQRDTLALVEKGIITPAQAVALQSGGSLFGGSGLSGITSNLSTIVMVGVAGYALFLFGPMLSRLLGGRK